MLLLKEIRAMNIDVTGIPVITVLLAKQKRGAADSLYSTLCYEIPLHTDFRRLMFVLGQL